MIVLYRPGTPTSDLKSRTGPTHPDDQPKQSSQDKRKNDADEDAALMMDHTSSLEPADYQAAQSSHGLVARIPAFEQRTKL